MERVRIYLPDAFITNAEEVTAELYKMPIKEIRHGLALPKGTKFMPTYEVEFENSFVPPKLIHNGAIKATHFDEVDQMYIYPKKKQEFFTYTTAYLRTDVKKEEIIRLFSKYNYTTGIYEGEHPIAKNFFDRGDGIIIIAEDEKVYNKLDDIEKRIRELLNPPSFIVTKEKKIYPLNI